MSIKHEFKMGHYIAVRVVLYIVTHTHTVILLTVVIHTTFPCNCHAKYMILATSNKKVRLIFIICVCASSQCRLYSNSMSANPMVPDMWPVDFSN